MKINKIYISAFGGLKDFTLDLADGLNVIYGNNEDGKSTVAAFIKAMFYGTGRNTKSIADSVRLKYTPWDNSTMAGRIYFEHQNKRYCLEREFRKSDSTDRITLTDLDSGKSVDTAESVGQQFFGLSCAAFERSLFIGNGDFIKDDAAASEINGKLSNIAITGSEDVSYKQVEKNILDTRNKLISKSGRTGTYNQDLQTKASFEERLEKADSDAKLKARLNNKAQEIRAEYETLYKKYIELKSVIDREQDIKNREKLVEFLDTKRKLDELNASLTLADGTIINENFTGKLEFGVNKYKAAYERCSQITQDVDRVNQTIALQNASPKDTKEQIDKLLLEVNNLNAKKEIHNTNESKLTSSVDELKLNLEAAQNKKAKVNPAFLILSIILAAGGGAGAFVSPILAVVMIIIAAVMLTLSFVIKPKNTTAINAAQNELANANNALAESKAEKNKIQEQINELNARVNTLNSVLQADNTIKQQRLEELAQKQESLQTETEKLKAIENEILLLLSAFGDVQNIEQAQQTLAVLKQKTEQQKEIKLQLKTASQYLGNIDYVDAEQKLASMSESNDTNVDFDAVKADYDVVTEKLSTKKDELTQIATELKTSFKNSENPEELKREIKLLQEKIDSKKAFCDAADIARQVLEESFYELRRGYGSELEKATHDIFACLTDGKYKSVSVTDTLDLSVEKTDVFGTHDLNYLSLGTTHQAYLSLRLAIAKLISGDTTLPVFLDDSLSQYDDTRTARAIKFLKEFCADGQGMLFTCHNAICEIAKEHNVEVIKPYK